MKKIVLVLGIILFCSSLFLISTGLFHNCNCREILNNVLLKVSGAEEEARAYSISTAKGEYVSPDKVQFKNIKQERAEQDRINLGMDDSIREMQPNRVFTGMDNVNQGE